MIEDDETLEVLKQEAFRTLSYKKDSNIGISQSNFDKIDKLTFIDDDQAWSINENSDSYYTKYDGSINLTNAYMAEVLYTKPHFLQFGNASIIPTIKYHNGSIIKPQTQVDSTFYEVEPFTGMNLNSRESYQINYMWQ